MLAEFEGDLGIGEVTAQTLRHFRDHHLRGMPARENQVRQQFGTSSMRDSILAIAGKGWPLMSADERDLRMQWLSRMFKWFHAQKWIPDDPSTGLKGESVLTKAQKKTAVLQRKNREEFTETELTAIFSAPVYQVGGWKKTKAGTFRTTQPFHYWLPLLGFFTGARIGELAQLRLVDVRDESGVWVIDINENSPDKSIKNAWSKRLIPLHPRLLELGFLAWCDLLRQEKFVRVFPELSWSATNRYAKDPIRVMSQVLEGLGMSRDGTKVFHSVRHGMNNNLQKRSSMPDIMRKRLLGHEPGEGVNERHYLSDPTPQAMLKHMLWIGDKLPSVGSFDLNAGLASVQDALRRKNKGHGSLEALGPTNDQP